MLLRRVRAERTTTLRSVVRLCLARPLAARPIAGVSLLAARYLWTEWCRGPNHIRITAIGSAGQNMSGDTSCVGGASTKGNRFAAAIVGAALLLLACRRLKAELTGFFADSLGRGFFVFRICFSPILRYP